MSTGANRYFVQNRINPVFTAGFRNSGKFLRKRFLGKITSIQVNILGVGLDHAFEYGSADDVPGGQLHHRMNVLHEPVPLNVNQGCSGSANGLRDKKSGTTGHVKGRGMKLNELTVFQTESTTERGRHTVPRNHIMVGGLPIELTQPAGRQYNSSEPQQFKSLVSFDY
jgi:hypothetical protein